MAKIFIDGESGTTGLGIKARLEAMPEIELVSLPQAARKDPQAKAALLRQVDLAVLCLPDVAARETANLVATLGDAGPRILDASTAHRVAPGWIYGFPEWRAGQAEAIGGAKLVANPGCYATGAIALLHPLVAAGVVPGDFPITINAISGYSGGGRAMIAEHDAGQAPSFELYALDLEHKHVPEIMAYGGLARRPIFVPSVGHFAQGMLVSIPLFLDALPGKPKGRDLEAALAAHYGASAYVRVVASAEQTRIEPESLNGSNRLELRVFANETHRQVVLVATLDNLGKGASGAAVQNLGLMLDLDLKP